MLEIALRTMRRCYPPFLGAGAVEEYIRTGSTERYLKDNVANCHVLLLEDAIVGMAVCRGHLLDLLMIDPDHHRKGCGRLLMTAVEERLFQACERIELESFESNDIANTFYRRTGWQEVERYVDPESGFRKIRFAKGRR